MGWRIGTDCKDIFLLTLLCVHSPWERRCLEAKGGSLTKGKGRALNWESGRLSPPYLGHGDWTGSPLKALPALAAQPLVYVNCWGIQRGKCQRSCKSRLISQSNGPGLYLLGCLPRGRCWSFLHLLSAPREMLAKPRHQAVDQL